MHVLGPFPVVDHGTIPHTVVLTLNLRSAFSQDDT
jgi:hypothetical protein